MLYPLISLLAAQAGATVPLESLDLSAMNQSYGEPRRAATVDGHPLIVAGRRFEHGVGTHAASEMVLGLAGNAKKFRATVGVDDETDGKGTVRFLVIVDGKTLADSGVMRAGDAAKELSADLTRAKILKLVVEDGGDGISYDHADWGDAVIEVVDASKKIRPFVLPKEPPMPIAPVDLVTTRINGARVVGGTPGRPFLFRIPISGKAPITTTIHNFPRGLQLDAGNGTVLRGTMPPAGVYKMTVTAEGPGGKDTREITLVSGDHQLAKTPPMGWNSWNVWGTTVTADKVRAAADAFEKLGLANAGYTYVNIDDAWEGGRNASGEIETNAKFGDMTTLTQYVHAKGLRVGIYSSPGPKTCGGYEGTWGHEVQDANTWANWGIDYVKHDWCSYGQIAKPGLTELKKPYEAMRAALDGASRDIVFSLCQYGMGDVWEWGGRGAVKANLWRTTGDIEDTWNSMSGIGFSGSKWSTGARPGNWNDPDMLVVGRLGWGGTPRANRLTGNEQITHITLWSLLAAPLLIGCDLTQMDDFTRRILMNPEVIDVDQDSLGDAATVRSKQGETEVWARRLSDGSFAVGLFNRGTARADVAVDFERDIRRVGTMKVRDLWLRKDLGTFGGGYTMSVPAHGAKLIRVSPVE